MTRKKEGPESWLIKKGGFYELPGFEGSAQEDDVVSQVFGLKKLRRQHSKIDSIEEKRASVEKLFES